MFFDEQLNPVEDEKRVAVGMPPQQGEQFPQPGPGMGMPAPVHKQSIWERIHGGLNNIAGGLGKMKGAINNRLMPVPQGMEGILSAGDMKAARHRGWQDFGMSMLQSTGPQQGGGPAPGLFGAIGQGLGAQRGGYEGNMQQTLQTAQVMKAQRDVEAEKTAVAALARKYPMIPGETKNAMNQRMRQMFFEMGTLAPATAKGYSEVIKGLDDDKATDATDVSEWVENEKGGKTLRNKLTGKPILDPQTGKEQTIAKYVAPKDTSVHDDLQANRTQNYGTQLRSDFNDQTGKLRPQLRKIENVMLSIPRAMKGSGADQIHMLYAFINALDPNAVREGEIALAQRAASIKAIAQGWVTQLEGNKSVLLKQEQVDQMETIMREIYENGAAFNNEQADFYSQLGRDGGVQNTEHQFQRLKPLAPKPGKMGTLK